MAGKIPNLWPETISVETLSPIAILRAQAENLTQRTHGLLQGEIITNRTSKETVSHHFDIIAPALNGYRHRILTVRHNNNLVYPAYFDVGGYILYEEDGKPSIANPSANTEADFIHLLTNALTSGYVLSVISSLIARSNETQPEKDVVGSKELQPA